MQSISNLVSYSCIPTPQRTSLPFFFFWSSFETFPQSVTTLCFWKVESIHLISSWSQSPFSPLLYYSPALGQLRMQDATQPYSFLFYRWHRPLIPTLPAGVLGPQLLRGWGAVAARGQEPCLAALEGRGSGGLQPTPAVLPGPTARVAQRALFKARDRFWRGSSSWGTATERFDSVKTPHVIQEQFSSLQRRLKNKQIMLLQVWSYTSSTVLRIQSDYFCSKSLSRNLIK